MEITDIKIKHLRDEGRMRAIVSVTFDNEFAVHDIKIIEGQDKFFLAMPSRRMQDGTYRDIVHPISPVMRSRLEQRVLELYQATVPEEGAQTVAATPVDGAPPAGSGQDEREPEDTEEE